VERVVRQQRGAASRDEEAGEEHVRPPAVPAAAVQALALQRAAGNQATTRLIQRRLPDFAVVGPEIMGSTAEARVAEKKLKQVIRRTIAGMRAHGPLLLMNARLTFTGRHPGMNLEDLLDEATPLDDTRKAMIGDLIAALQAAQASAGRAQTEVTYPRPGVTIGPPTGTAQANLALLVAAALWTMRGIAAGNHSVMAQQVFGPFHLQAQAVLGEAADALERLFTTPGAIVVDSRGDQAAVHAGGLTDSTQMALSPEVLASVTLEHQVTIIHESTHAIAKATTDDAYVDLTPGSAFLKATEAQRVGRAPYYEELARGVLGIRPLPVFTPIGAGQPGGAASQAQAAVEEMVSRAWTVAINTRDSLVNWARLQTTPQYAAWTAPQRKQFGTQLANVSRAVGLTIHHRLPPNGHAPTISDLDLVIAEDRAVQLSKLIKKAQAFTAQDARTGLTWLLGKSTHEHVVDQILTQVVAAHGHSRKDAAKEEAMIRALASVYETGRVSQLMKGVPAPLAAYY
jgi:hypothetical protein